MSDLSTFQDLQNLDSSIFVFLPYATSDNFIRHKVYPTGCRAYLRSPIAKSLIAAHQELKSKGYAIKVWDAYRPFHIQELLWKAFPDERYVAKPVRNGDELVMGSVHNRGAAVDLTLVTSGGKELEMPTPFDEFTERAHRNYSKASSEAIRHRNLLEDVLHKHGFVGLPTEWWHFDWKEAFHYPLTDVSIVDPGQ